MDRLDYYKQYQLNIELLDCEIEQVKKSAQTVIGKKAWQESVKMHSSQIAVTEKEIRACTRLYSFLICSWFEARLMKILYENSSVAFSDAEIAQIRSIRKMEMKWKTCFLMAICKGYGITYSGNIDYSPNFPAKSLELQNYLDVCVLLGDIRDAITIRNRLAHGQWEVQFNSDNTAITNYSFLTNYDNIQKLDILKQCYNEIAEIISAYVTYKDKKTANFENLIRCKISSVFNKKTRIQNSDYQKYVSQLRNRYENQRKRCYEE